MEAGDCYLLLTYLIADKLGADKGICSTEFRAAASHHGLADTPEFKKINDMLYKDAVEEEEAEAKANGGMASL